MKNDVHKCFSVILVMIIDQLSKYVYLYPLQHLFIVKEDAPIFIF